MLWAFIDFVRPYLKANMEDAEERRENARQYLRHREELASFYKQWFRTTNVVKEEHRTATDLSQYVEDSAPGTRYQPGRRKPDFSLDDKAPFVYSRRY